ncbi:meta-pathway phenol degradation-like protein [Vibrio breoganii]|uniref:Transporter n=1 Tax=Vibrio breoganii TaxID=553239 RepID=A0ABX1UBF0_9VIBR|nr:transporter [Vibrio breoganii]NMO75292.1 transporter [Vibrio breoganii]NMR71829.1 transporter [Vibrio breoganii]PMG02686.1 meta-pathway phenol degradation-like protein [Vibrio breoganii]PML86399.1 meta-pathway phenol degradation-like protein [Vibrio breoganii]TKG24267.1 transporter [Vibrio breoganii]
MTKHNLTKTLSLSLALVLPTQVLADGLFGAGHYSPGVSNLRDLSVPRESGFIYEQYNIYYTADTFTDSSGNDLGLNDDSYNVFAVAPSFVWTTDKELFGARYAFSFNPLLVNNESAGEDLSGMGDLFVQPLWLGWQEDTYDINFGAGVYMPTGNSDVTLDFWTAQLQTSGYYYVMEGAGAFMLAATYETHTRSDSTDVKPGDHLSLEYGYSQYLTQQLEVGIRGYSQWQVESDDITDFQQGINEKRSTSIGSQSQVHGIGVSVGYWINGSWNITANAAKEYYSESRLEGETYSINVTYSPKPIF